MIEDNLSLNPVPEFLLEDASALAALLKTAPPDHDTRDLRKRLEQAALHLALRFTHTLEDEKALARRARRYADDPARALASPAANDDDEEFRSALIGAVEAKGVDPQSWHGTAAIGNLAKTIADAPMPRKDQSFRIGEAELFQRVIHAARALCPAHNLALPANENRSAETPLTMFAERFVEIVCDLARVAIGPGNLPANARLDSLKGRRLIVDGLRHARKLLTN